MSAERGRRTVVFLGAGASRPFGYPLTAGILPAIWSGLHTSTGKHSWTRWAGMKGRKDEAARLRDFLSMLYPGLNDSQSLEDSISIVDVISLVEQMALEGRSPSPALGEQDVLLARRVLNKAINGVLHGRRKREYAERLARWVLGTAMAHEDNRVTVISTNYDTAVERHIFDPFVTLGISIGKHIDFGMHWRDAFRARMHVRPAPARMALLKLHGSLNWLRCEVCGHITVNVRKRIAAMDHWQPKVRQPYNTCWCNGVLRSILVTPSIVRDVRDANLLGIWKAAVEDLRMADEWIFVGYSLPAEDIAIRSLLLRAWHARRARRLKVRVVQRELPPARADAAAQPSETYRRYRLLFPSANLKERDYSREGVEVWVDGLEAPSEKDLMERLRATLGGISERMVAKRERQRALIESEREEGRARQARRRQRPSHRTSSSRT